MARITRKSKNKKKNKHLDESDTEPLSSSLSSSPSPSSSSSDDLSESSSKRRRKSSRREKDGDDKASSSRRKRHTRRREKERRHKDRDRGERKRRKRKSRQSRVSDSDTDGESGSGYSDEEGSGPESVVRVMLEEFPGVASDLKQLLQMIDNGQAVDIKGVSEKPLMKYLKKLFVSLDLKEKGDRVFLLRSKARPTLELVGPIIASQIEVTEQKTGETLPPNPDVDDANATDDVPTVAMCPNGETSGPRRRTIGPEMPSAELLAAAAKLTEAQAELREAELEQDDGIFIGPPPPALVTEAESANDAERFEEVTRIMGVEGDNPYDIVGVNHKMPAANIKKRYWKLSLLVHPDKCPHPQANQAFIKLNKAFKDLQDPDKRKALDESIKKKEEEEEMKADLRSMREAALWRRSQGLAMEGDDVLLAEVDVKAPPKRDEWMTTLPPERKPGGMPMHSTFFSKSAKEGRGDTSAWTDAPSDKAQKAKMNYLEAYNEAAALAANEENKKASNADAELVDQYNKAKRSKSLVQKHKEESEKSRSKKKSKQQAQAQQPEEQEWVGKHPWKPWDREKDLTAGRMSVKLDPENMSQGLSSRFSAGNFQRSFL